MTDDIKISKEFIKRFKSGCYGRPVLPSNGTYDDATSTPEELAAYQSGVEKKFNALLEDPLTDELIIKKYPLE
jgi:hypothetical protein